MIKQNEHLKNDSIYLIAQASGFLLGISTQLDDRRKAVAVDLAKRLQEINDNIMKGSNEQ